MFVRLFLWLLILPVLMAFSVAEVPNPQISHRGWVSDTTNTITSSDEQLLERSLQQIVDETGVEVALVTVQQCAETPKAFAGALFEEWKIGDSETDRGLLILMVMGKRRLEMETGYGLEGDLPDGWLVGMQRQHMVPWFKQGEYGLGLMTGVEKIAKRLGVSALPQATTHGGTGQVEKAGDSGAGLAALQARVDGALRAQAEARFAESDRQAWEERERRLLAQGKGEGAEKLSIVLFLFVFLGLGLGAGLWWVRFSQRGASAPSFIRRCEDCGGKRRLLDEMVEDEHLSADERSEENEGKADNEVWQCRKCGSVAVHRRAIVEPISFEPSEYSRPRTDRDDSDSFGMQSSVRSRSRTSKKSSNFSSASSRSSSNSSSASSRSSSSRKSGGGSFGGGRSGGGGGGSSW